MGSKGSAESGKSRKELRIMGSKGSAESGKFNDAKSITTNLQNTLDRFGLNISRENLAAEVYNSAKNEGMNISILNEKYIKVENGNGTVEFSFTKSKKEDKWKLTPMLAWNDISKGRHNGVTMFRAAGQWHTRKEDAEQAVVKKKLG